VPCIAPGIPSDEGELKAIAALLSSAKLPDPEATKAASVTRLLLQQSRPAAVLIPADLVHHIYTIESQKDTSEGLPAAYTTVNETLRTLQSDINRRIKKPPTTPEILESYKSDTQAQQWRTALHKNPAGVAVRGGIITFNEDDLLVFHSKPNPQNLNPAVYIPPDLRERLVAWEHTRSHAGSYRHVDEPHQAYGIDFFTPPVKSITGHTALLVVVDLFHGYLRCPSQQGRHGTTHVPP
jgi:hypothetical protein